VAWDSICADEANTFPECVASCRCADGGGACSASNCCEANGGLGCNDRTCEALVCGIDSFCCNVAWDSICADEANTFPECVAGCTCADGGGTSGSNCCEPNGGLGCNDRTCEALVCAIDSFCCNVAWDSICADEAATFPECVAGCNSGDGGGGPASNCCSANGGLGCDNDTCEALVCGIDSFCCNVAWDSICADEAATFPECGC
jgi:hypothetical protein